MGWKIVDLPNDANGDVAPWRYEIERDGERRSIFVENDVSSLAEVRVVSEKVERAIKTRGRAAVEGILTEEDPLSQLYITVYGVARYLTTAPRPHWLDNLGSADTKNRR